jgi:4'-phosphopantetheinyl transferase
VCAVCLDHPVGVDTEAVDAALFPTEVQRGVLGPAEIEALEPLVGEARLERLFTLWTLKEACLKARGEGLAEPPTAVSFALGSGGAPTAAFAPPIADDPAAWRFHATLLPSRHALAVAVRCPPGEPLRFRLPE